MRHILPIVAIAALFMISCRANRSISDIGYSQELSYADTTKIVVDTIGRKRTDTDTTKTTAIYEDVGLIEFVESGGKVSIDSAGNVTFEGVKKVKTQHKGSIAQDKGVNHHVEEAAGHREQLNGVEADQTRHEKRIEEKRPSAKWYETAFARLGQGICIAALIWLLFLYLKRKF